MNKNITIGYVFLIVGLGNLIMMIDTFLTNSDQAFSIMSFPTNKEFNILFYGIIGVFLVLAGRSQIKILTKKEK